MSSTECPNLSDGRFTFCSNRYSNLISKLVHAAAATPSQFLLQILESSNVNYDFKFACHKPIWSNNYPSILVPRGCGAKFLRTSSHKIEQPVHDLWESCRVGVCQLLHIPISQCHPHPCQGEGDGVMAKRQRLRSHE